MCGMSLLIYNNDFHTPKSILSEGIEKGENVAFTSEVSDIFMIYESQVMCKINI
jgi:hypothetical protein